MQTLFIYKTILITEGRKHDAGMLGESGLMRDLERFAHSPTGEAMCLYGDPANPLRIHMQAPFRDANLTDETKAYNKLCLMSNELCSCFR